ERAMSAAQQLRDYHRQQAEQQKKSSLRGISSVQPKVGISIDKTSGTTSTIFFYDNFESGAHTWTTELYGGTTDNIWHRTTLNSSSPTHSWWAGIDGLGNYNTGRTINTAVVSELINLTGAVGSVTLMFAENYATEHGWDDCMVDVTTDSEATWTHLRGGYGAAPSGSSNGWTITSLDLTPYAGKTIKIRFYFDTFDANFNDFAGWFIDDIVVFDQRGTIKGQKFFDVNNNGVKDPGERGIKNWLITATGPVTITTSTGYRGHYSLTLPLGSYTVTEAFEPNWTQKYPLAGHWNINLTTPDTVVDTIRFGNYTQSSFINGMKFDDINRDSTFDTGDTAMQNWKIVLSDTNGNDIDYDITDSLGQYSLYVFQPGVYVVHEVGKPGWVESYPANESYTITIPDLNTTSNGNNFGNYYDDSVNTIMGRKFNDLNRSGIEDPRDPGIAGIQIKLSGTKSKTVKTDSSGYYQFLSLPSGHYTIKEIPQMGWWQSYPESSYAVTCYSGQLIDSLDFGNYAISTGSISGLKYNDLNGNGFQDSSETGLSGWTITVNGSTYFGSSVLNSATTDGNGNYSFSGLWPGHYTVSEVFRSNWRQTQPDHLQPYHINLGVEQDLTGIKFGNHRDSTFSLSFRTFIPESLALSVDAKGKHQPIPAKPDQAAFGFSFVDNAPQSQIMSTLTVKFNVAVLDSVQINRTGTQVWNAKNNSLNILFAAPVDSGDTVTISGIGIKPKLETISKAYWTNNLSKKVVVAGTNTFSQLLYPEPNAINVVQLVGGGLKVGLGGPHSVVHGTWKDVMKSLVGMANRIQSGDPRCLATYTNGSSIKKQQRSLTPTQENNKLFGEAIALQANILASDMDVTPGGFGNLIFDEGTGIDSLHPFNGKSIRTVAGLLDEFMSSVKDTNKTSVCRDTGALKWMSPEAIYETIRMIDSAFIGPIDTISFASKAGLQLTPVKPLSAATFLRLDTSSTNKPFTYIHSVSRGIPDVFTLNQNYPNPFNPTTEIDFYIPLQSVVTIKVYNILGQEVANLVNREVMDAGSYQYQLSATTANLASGVYFYRMVAETVVNDENPAGQVFTDVKKMLLVK
ncbi:MAG TPA: SdrD B-like domain-containing protein, partial [Bacteroidota bacterium]|nr:SdrD B-like domain-containing protein [Bacteroidota bacterium]